MFGPVGHPYPTLRTFGEGGVGGTVKSHRSAPPPRRLRTRGLHRVSRPGTTGRLFPVTVLSRPQPPPPRLRPPTECYSKTGRPPARVSTTRIYISYPKTTSGVDTHDWRRGSGGGVPDPTLPPLPGVTLRIRKGRLCGVSKKREASEGILLTIRGGTGRRWAPVRTDACFICGRMWCAKTLCLNVMLSGPWSVSWSKRCSEVYGCLERRHRVYDVLTGSRFKSGGRQLDV